MTTSERLSAALSDRYRVERELGRGGMATVYLAHDLKHERDVAIKVLHPDLGAALGAERFLSEIKTTAKLQHPHILALLDSGAADGLLYYVMPFIAGETLRARLDRERQLPIDDALSIAREVADALGAAHALGIVHRDVKPENILLQNGHAIVADFGIALAVQAAGGARMTQTGLSLGTPQYMSPEQAMGERHIDARADIYALGAVTYEMLTGDAPFTGSSVQAIVARVLTEKPQSISTVRDTVPFGAEQAVLRALSKLPADRFASTTEFVAALTANTTAADRHAVDTPFAQAPTDRSRRLRVIAAALAVTTVASLVVAAWALTRGTRRGLGCDLRCGASGQRADGARGGDDRHRIRFGESPTVGRASRRLRRVRRAARRLHHAVAPQSRRCVGSADHRHVGWPQSAHFAGRSAPRVRDQDAHHDPAHRWRRASATDGERTAGDVGMDIRYASLRSRGRWLPADLARSGTGRDRGSKDFGYALRMGSVACRRT
ncbi:MAG: serine/threonine protein kinase [Gemmatimonadaceae bacterium]|nr:serine/threonine protein kinase [Gemmatimonadaceae bacterium]